MKGRDALTLVVGFGLIVGGLVGALPAHDTRIVFAWSLLVWAGAVLVVFALPRSS